MENASIFRHKRYILDASSVINLYATARMPEIIDCLPVRFSVSQYVKEWEAVSVLEAPDSNGDQQCIPIELGDIVSSGVLEIFSDDSPSVANGVIELARAGVRGMGEKLCAAIALATGCGIVLDDKVATTKLQHMMPQIQMLTTFDLVKFWACHENICEPVIREALRNIRIRGNFRIAEWHPLYAWVSCNGG